MNKLCNLFIKFYCLIFVSCVFAQKESYNVGVLLDNRSEKIEPLLIKLQTQIKAVVGEDANIFFSEENIYINDYSLASAEANYQKLLSNQTDIIIAFGMVNNKIISQRQSYPKPTILFGAVNEDFKGIDFSKKTSEVENFTYLIESRSYLDDLKTFKELTGFKNVGVLIEQPIIDLFELSDIFNPIFNELNADYTLISLENMASKLHDVDAVYLAGGFFLNEAEVKQLAINLINKELPSFTNSGIKMVENGIMATNQSDTNLDQFIRRMALTVEGYVNGAKLSEMPVFVDYSPRLTINYRTAQKLEVPIKFSLISNTNFVGGNNASISTESFNLIEILDKALLQNLGLQSQQKEIELNQQDVKTAKSNYLPDLSTSATATYLDPDSAENSLGSNPEFSTTGNVTLQQTIFSEAANANISIQKRLQEAQQENFNASQLDVIFESSNAYFNILILKANVQIQMRNLELTRENLKIAEQNFEAGQSGKSDLLRFKSQMAQDTQAVVEAINQLKQGYIFLNQVLNNPLDTEIEIKDAALDDSIFSDYNYEELVNLLDNPTTRDTFINFLVQEAKNNAPELKSLDYNLKAVDRSLRLNSGGRFLPTVALLGQYNRVFSRDGAGSTPPPSISQLDQNYNVGVNVSIPILNQNRTNINRQANIIQKEQLSINIENSELAIDSNVRSSILQLVNQISNIQLSKVSEEAAKEALELTQASYTNGAVSIIQLIDAQNNYLNAQIASTNAIYNFLINGIELERSLGYYFLLNTKEDNAKFTQRFFEYLNEKN